MSGVLFVDVQAVGSPGKGFPLEIAWKEPGTGPHCFFFLNHHPQIPVRVRRMTGIEPFHLEGHLALELQEIRQLFTAAAGLQREPLRLVAHHSVYEKRWLDYITGLDLEILCTRELAREKLEGLASGSLRAVAGLVGHVMGPMRRASEHVVATEAIYTALTEGYSHKPVKRAERLSLPAVPGVYRFIDPGGNVLYVGKAMNLKSRVNSHFTGRPSGRKAEMLARVSSLEYTGTETAFHAAVLESSLISSLSPEYNRSGRILDERLWYLSRDLTRVSHRREGPGCFGPFTDRWSVDGLSMLVSAMRSDENKATFVDNFFGEVPLPLFDSVFDEWAAVISARGILQYGKDAYSAASENEADDRNTNGEVIDEGFVRRRLDGIVTFGALMCRRAAVLGILSGCRVEWRGEESGCVVYNFVENSVNEPDDQAKVRKLMVVLAEIKRIYRSGTGIELYTRSGRVLAGDRLSSLLALV